MNIGDIAPPAIEEIRCPECNELQFSIDWTGSATLLYIGLLQATCSDCGHTFIIYKNYVTSKGVEQGLTTS